MLIKYGQQGAVIEAPLPRLEGIVGGVRPTVGLMALATYLPEQVQNAAYIAEQSGIEEDIVRHKLGIRQKRRAGPADHASTMALKAATLALERAGVEAQALDLILYSGSMHKDFYVWSAANRVQYLLGATHAYAFELAALCTTNVLALKVARDLMTADPQLRTVLICGGHRTADLIDFRDQSSRFLFNLSDGGSAMVLRRDYPANHVLASSFLTDGSLAEEVVIPAGGTRLPTSRETLERGLHTFHVSDAQKLRDGLDDHSEQRFVQVVCEAVERSGYTPADIAFLAINHMKPSTHRRILAMLGLQEQQSLYLADYGHIGAPDQVLALELASASRRLKPGDLVVMASAGLGFTWGATAILWG